MVYTLVSSVVPVVLAGLVVEISISGPCLFDPCRLLNIMESFSLPEDDWWLRLASCSVVSSKSCRFSVVSRRMRFRKSRIIVCLSEGISSPCSSYTGLINSMHVNSSAVDRCSRLHWGQFHLIFWPMTFCMHSWQKVWPQGVIRTGGWKKSEQINGSICHIIYVSIHILYIWIHIQYIMYIMTHTSWLIKSEKYTIIGGEAWVGIDMYKIVIFLKSVLLYKNMLFLGSFERFFRKSHREFFLTPRHVSKVIFSGNFLENLIFECNLILPQPWFLLHFILHFLLHLLMWKNRVGVRCSKSYGLFTIPDSKKFFVIYA